MIKTLFFRFRGGHVAHGSHHVGLRMLLVVSLLFVSMACSKSDSPAPEPEPTPDPEPEVIHHTVMAYLPGTSLLSFYLQNLQAMCEGASEEALKTNRVLVCYQPKGAGTATILEIMNNGTKVSMTRTVKSYREFNPSDPTCIATMFDDMMAEAPAESYGVIIGSHGKAWVSASSGALSLPAQPGVVSYWQTAEGALPTRSFGDTGAEMNITDLASVLEGLSVKPEYLIFDACFMANIETLYDLRNSVDYIVASPCEVMGTGFPYDRIMPILLSSESVEEKMQQTCYEFYDSFNTQTGVWQSACVSMAVTSELDALAEVMKSVHAGATRAYEASELQIYDALSTPLFFDLGDFANHYCADEALLNQFETQMEAAFPSSARFHTPAFYSAYNNELNPIHYYTGVTVSEPSLQYVMANRSTNWYLASH